MYKDKIKMSETLHSSYLGDLESRLPSDERLPVLAESVREMIANDAHKIMELSKEYAPDNVRQENGWTIARAEVPDSSIAPGAPASGAYTCVEIMEPSVAVKPAEGQIIRQITYFEEVRYDDAPDEREPLMTIIYVHEVPVVSLKIHDPALRKKFNSAEAVDNVFGLDVHIDLKDAYRELRHLPLGTLALDAQRAA